MTQIVLKKINILFFDVNCIKINKRSKVILWTLLVVLFVVSIFYAYFVNGTIMNVMEREKLENNIGELNSEISDLEARYIADDIDISREYAKSLGYKTVTNIKYLSLNKKFDNLTIHVVEEE